MRLRIQYVQKIKLGHANSCEKIIAEDCQGWNHYCTEFFPRCLQYGDCF